MQLLHRAIDYLQAKLPPNRIVVLLTPLLFVPLAGTISAWVAEHFPGLQLSDEAVIGFAAAGALSALTAAYKWIDGWQAEERAANELFNNQQIIKAEAKAAKKD